MKFFILFNLLFYFNLCNSSNLLIECDTIGLQKDTLILIDTKVGCIDKILNANNNKNITLHIINEDLYYNELFKGINNIKSLEIFLIDGKLHFNTRDTFLFQKLEQVVLSFNTNFLPRGLLLSPNLRVFMFTDNKCNNNYNSDLNLIFKNLVIICFILKVF